MQLNLPDTTATETMGRALAHCYRMLARASATPGSATVIYLRGDLGAGKTTCVRSLLRALGVTGLVRSPTYTLVESYTVAQVTAVHVDLYRLQAALEVDDLGLRDYLETASLLLVEWPERGVGFLPAADLELGLDYASNGDAQGRTARLDASSSTGDAWLSVLASDTSLSPYVFNIT